MTSGSTFTHLIVTAASGPLSAPGWSRAPGPDAPRSHAAIEPLEQGVALVPIAGQPAVLAKHLGGGIERAAHRRGLLVPELGPRSLADALTQRDDVPEQTLPGDGRSGPIHSAYSAIGRGSLLATHMASRSISTSASWSSWRRPASSKRSCEPWDRRRRRPPGHRRRWPPCRGAGVGGRREAGGHVDRRLAEVRVTVRRLGDGDPLAGRLARARRPGGPRAGARRPRPASRRPKTWPRRMASRLSSRRAWAWARCCSLSRLEV